MTSLVISIYPEPSVYAALPLAQLIQSNPDYNPALPISKTNMPDNSFSAKLDDFAAANPEAYAQLMAGLEALENFATNQSVVNPLPEEIEPV